MHAGTCAHAQCTLVIGSLHAAWYRHLLSVLRSSVFAACSFTIYFFLFFLYSIWPVFVTWPDVISVGAVLGDRRGHSSVPPPNTPCVVLGGACLTHTLPNLHQTSGWWLLRWRFNWQGKPLSWPLWSAKCDKTKYF